MSQVPIYQLYTLASNEIHLVEPYFAFDSVIELLAYRPGHADDHEMGIRPGCELDALQRPFGIAHEARRVCEELGLVVKVEDLQPWSRIGSDSFSAHVRGKLVMRIGFDEHDLKDVTIVNVPGSVEFDVKRADSVKVIQGIDAHDDAFHGIHSPIEASIQDFEFKTPIRDPIAGQFTWMNAVGKA